MANTKGKKTTNIADQIGDISEQLEGISVEGLKERVSGLSDRVRSSVGEFKDRAQSTLGDIRVSEATIPDAFENAPKFISPTVHAWLDAAVTGYFLGLGAWFAISRRKGAATAAFLNAGMVAGVSLMTDYQGNGDKPISFKLHGTLDALQAATAAVAPALHGFAGKAESAFFYGQALNEVAVIAVTDWDKGIPGRSGSRSAA